MTDDSYREPVDNCELDYPRKESQVMLAGTRRADVGFVAKMITPPDTAAVGRQSHSNQVSNDSLRKTGIFAELAGDFR